MATEATRQLRLLQGRYAKVLAQIKPLQLDVLCADGRTVRDLIGLLLMDLDRLASPAAFGRDGVPGYASAFMDRRLAGRWTARYQADTVAAEADRRFVKARAAAPDRPTPEYEQALSRMAAHCTTLTSTLRRQADGA